MKSVDILLDVGRVLFGMVALDNGAAVARLIIFSTSPRAYARS
jgi:hypothetical protein